MVGLVTRDNYELNFSGRGFVAHIGDKAQRWRGLKVWGHPAHYQTLLYGSKSVLSTFDYLLVWLVKVFVVFFYYFFIPCTINSKTQELFLIKKKKM